MRPHLGISDTGGQVLAASMHSVILVSSVKVAVRVSRVDAAVNDAMEGEHASPAPSRCCVTSFGGAADETWGESASPAQAGEDGIDAAVLQQIANGVRRAQHYPQPWWLAAADGAPTDRTGQRRAGKHARIGSGKC